MTEAEWFEIKYAAASGVSVEFLHHWGRYAEPCDCDAPECEGWMMGHQHEDALFDALSAGPGSRPPT